MWEILSSCLDETYFLISSAHSATNIPSKDTVFSVTICIVTDAMQLRMGKIHTHVLWLTRVYNVAFRLVRIRIQNLPEKKVRYKVL